MILEVFSNLNILWLHDSTCDWYICISFNLYHPGLIQSWSLLLSWSEYAEFIPFYLSFVCSSVQYCAESESIMFTFWPLLSFEQLHYACPRETSLTCISAYQSNEQKSLKGIRRILFLKNTWKNRKVCHPLWFCLGVLCITSKDHMLETTLVSDLIKGLNLRCWDVAASLQKYAYIHMPFIWSFSSHFSRK